MMKACTSGTMDYTVGGNLIDDNWTGREYEWDQFNRVTMVNNGSGVPQFGFEYGGTGERSVQTTYTGGVVSSTRAFLYDREDVIAEFSNDTFATLFRRYIHGPGIDEPLAILGDDVGEYTYYLHDGLGSVTGVVDENGKLGAIEYSAFGETRSNTVKIENRYRYTSREFVETNLYYYRARHMRPDLGRFISMDPLKMIDGTNMYKYVGNDPVIKVDPNGSDTAGCDQFRQFKKITTGERETLCQLQCCAQHDRCFDLHCCLGGPMRFAREPLNSPCRICNDTVIRCMETCLRTGHQIDPDLPFYYCRRLHKFIEIPGDFKTYEEARDGCSSEEEDCLGNNTNE